MSPRFLSGGMLARLRNRIERLGVLGAALAVVLAAGSCGSPLSGKPRVLIVVVDGLRPDYVTEDLMPTLDRLAQSGVRGMAHHAVIPTVTRVNGPSIFTGRYPGGHGLMGNSVYMPDVDPGRVLDASDAADLRTIDQETGGRLLTAPSLGELLAREGLVFFAASSGSSGSGMLMNHRGAGAGLVHYEFTIPDSLSAIVDAELGPLPSPSEEGSSVALVARAVDVILRIGLDRADADVLAVWLTEPDGTAHANGIGAPETLEVLRRVDEEIGRLLNGLAQRGVLDDTNILVTSDHGFNTHIGTTSLTDLLVETGLKDSRESLDVVVANGAIHVREGRPTRTLEIARQLQRTDWIGPVFAPAVESGSDLGSLPGTVSFDVIGWSHDRSADIFTSPNWTDAVNEYGYAGAVYSGGTAGHGSTSPFDVRATFIAAGPRIKSGVVSEVPTGNVDLTPTALFLMGVPVPGQIDGRVLAEALVDGPDPSSVEVRSDPLEVDALLPELRYRLTVERSGVGGITYVDGTRVERIRSDLGGPGVASRPEPDLPLVVLMDSSHPARVYDEETIAADRTNADVLTELLSDLPIHAQPETIGTDWVRDAAVRELDPELIVIHYSGFREEDGSGPRRRLRLLVSHFADSDTRFLIYSRARELALQVQVEDLLADLEAWRPGVLSRVSVFGLDDHGPRSWLSSETSEALKLRVREILGL